MAGFTKDHLKREIAAIFQDIDPDMPLPAVDDVRSRLEEKLGTSLSYKKQMVNKLIKEELLNVEIRKVPITYDFNSLGLNGVDGYTFDNTTIMRQEVGGWVSTVSKDQSKEFFRQPTDLAKYRYVAEMLCSAKKNEVWIQLLRNLPSKSSQHLAPVQTMGDVHFARKNYNEALKFYNATVARAPLQSQSWAEALLKRAICLMALNHFSEALGDLDRAATLPVPSSDLAERLRKQRDVCRKHIKQTSRRNRKDRKDLKYATVQVKNIFFESACAAVSMGEDDKMGRYLKANRGIRPGEVLIIERPYATALRRNYMYSHCFLCLKYAPALLESDKCMAVMYCSQKCLLADKSDHEFQCKVVEALAVIGAYQLSDMLALRTLTKALTDGYDIEKIMNAEPGVREPTYRPDDLQRVYDLVTNSNRWSADDLLRRALLAFVMVRALAEFSSFFEKYNVPEDVVGGFLLHFLQSAQCNDFGAGSTQIDKGTAKESIIIAAGGLYATISLLNQCCNRNVAVTAPEDKGIVRAIAPIKAGEPLFFSYGMPFFGHTRDERQMCLLTEYKFKCQCIACTEDWPMLSVLESRAGYSDVISTMMAETDRFSRSLVDRFIRHLEYLYKTVKQPHFHIVLCQEACMEGFLQFPDYHNN